MSVRRGTSPVELGRYKPFTPKGLVKFRNTLVAIAVLVAVMFNIGLVTPWSADLLTRVWVLGVGDLLAILGIDLALAIIAAVKSSIDETKPRIDPEPRIPARPQF